MGARRSVTVDPSAASSLLSDISGMPAISTLAAERHRIVLRPVIKCDRFSPQNAIDSAGDLRQTPFANRTVNRKMRHNHFLRIAALAHALAHYVLVDRLESHRLADHRANLCRHLRVAQ